MLTRLDSFTAVRGLVFGQYGEVSDDVRQLLWLSASRLGERRFAAYGFRTKAEATAWFVGVLRRRVGLHATREFARHRLRRLVYVGADRSTFVRARDRPGPGGALPDAAAGLRYQDAAAFQGVLGRRGAARE